MTANHQGWERQPSKTEWRRQLIQQRRTLSPEIWRQKSDRLCSHLQSSPLFMRSQTILAYFSFRQEPDLSPLFNDTQRVWGFPRCCRDRVLSWHPWSPGELLQKGDFGILEPDAAVPQLPPDAVDLILVPAVACDTRGYRLGYGGGFYDRMLSAVEWASKPTIGIVFEFAYLPQLPIDPWDRPLHGVCTEERLRIVR
jgi:5-formyltetrahydrofolate cyclo-ligase